MAEEAEAIFVVARADNTFWLADAFGRFGGGVLSYFLVEKLNPYIWLIIFAGCNLFGDLFIAAVTIFDADGPLWIVIPSFFIGLGVGGFWVLIA